MFELKPIHLDAVPRALEVAERYRLLNEPWEAESICRDVLGVDPTNQKALISLLLSLTDQFGQPGVTQKQAEDVLPRVVGAYERTYYAGVICERWAKASLHSHSPAGLIYDEFAAALERYQQAASLSPPGNDDAVLRWNACVRQLERHPHLRPQSLDDFSEGLGDHIPPRR